MLHRRDAMLRLGTAAGGAHLPPSPPPAIPRLLSIKYRQGPLLHLPLHVGGQPQQDMWDMKPDAPSGVRSPFEPIHTSVPGILLSDQMQPIAFPPRRWLAIVRSQSRQLRSRRLRLPRPHRSRCMSPPPAPSRQRPPPHRLPPSAPCCSTSEKNPPSRQASASPTRRSRRRPPRSTHGGFLGSIHDPVELGEVFHFIRRTPRRCRQIHDPLSLPDEISVARMQARRGLLEVLEEQDRASSEKSPHQRLQRRLRRCLPPHQLHRRQARPRSRTRIPRDPRPLRPPTNTAFLTSRRLEAGIRLVTVNWMFITPASKVYNVWDVHGGIGDLERGMNGYEMLPPAAAPPRLRPGLQRPTRRPLPPRPPRRNRRRLRR